MTAVDFLNMGDYNINMFEVIFISLFLIVFALIIQWINIKFPKFSRQTKAILEILFWIIIILSIIVPGAYSVWLR